jgi:adiponectin receptor
MQNTAKRPRFRDLKSSIKTKVQEEDVFKLGGHDDAPDWLRKKFILSGYRINFSFGLCAHSLFRIHNETLNIWTHLIPAIFVLLEILRITNNLSLPPISDFLEEAPGMILTRNAGVTVEFPVILYLIGAFSIFSNSVMYHLFHSHSNAACDFLTCSDYGGICFYMICITIAWNYYRTSYHSFVQMLTFSDFSEFTCEPEYLLLSICVSASFPTFLFVMSFSKKFMSEENSFYRAAFVSLTCWILAFPPYFKSYYVDGTSFGENMRRSAIPLMLGALCFGCKIPERLFPGIFDYWVRVLLRRWLSPYFASFIATLFTT